MTTWPDRDETLFRLKLLREKGPTYLALGICDNIRLTRKDADRLLRPLFVRWPDYSGDPTFPVKSYDADLDAMKAYVYVENAWDKDTQYGQSRWALLDFLIAEIEHQALLDFLIAEPTKEL